MVDIAQGTRKTLYTSVSNKTYAKLKKAKEMGWSSGRLIDYLVENYMPSVLLEDEIIEFEPSAQQNAVAL